MTNFYEPNEKRFQNAFWRPKSWFKQFGDSLDVPGRPNDLLVHQDNGKKVLIVCHTDYITPVMPYSEAQANYVLNHPNEFPDDAIFKAPVVRAREHQKMESQWVTAHAKVLDGPVVDDRLGCAIALGCSDWADVLLTDCEEIGKSTAAFFSPPRDYNWIVELDRRGTDVVTYQYTDTEWMKALRKHFTVGFGTFSDIGYMEKLGVSAVNVGIGYHNEHTRGAYWRSDETNAQLAKLRAFLGEFGETVFSHKPAAKSDWRASRHTNSGVCHIPWEGSNGIAKANHLPIESYDGFAYLGGVRHYWSEVTRTWEKCIEVGPPPKDPASEDMWDDDRFEAQISLDWLASNYPDQYRAIMELEGEGVHMAALKEYEGYDY